MSFKIFTLQLTGKIKDTDKVESERKTLAKNYEAFKEAESSKELETYHELDRWIKSGACDRKKKEIQALVFKGSKEYNELKEFKSLSKNKSITDYFKVNASDELNRFVNIDKSEKLKSYFELNEYVKGGQFQKEKSKIEAQKFEGSAEQKQLKELGQIQKSKLLKAYQKLNNSADLKNHTEFKDSAKLLRFMKLKNATERDKVLNKEFSKLKKDSEIREYFRFENSGKLKYYREMAGSSRLSRYEELLTITRSDSFKQKVAFLQDKKKVEKSEPWRKYLQFRELASSDDILFYQKFKKSSIYRNYLKVKDSALLKKYNELKELTTLADFLKRKAYLEDTKKWEKTEEYARYQQYIQLSKNPKIELYYKFVNSHAFDLLKHWQISFEDDFENSSLDFGKWTPNTLWADRLLGGNYSQHGDLQVYTGGKNTTTSHSNLTIHTRKEKLMGKQWKPDLGFIPVDFEYTSDTLSTIKSFWQKEGIFEAKIRFNPEKEVVCSCHLLGESVSPQITLVETGPKSRTGVLTFNVSKKPEFSGVNLKNLKKGKFYIFGLEWENNHFTWKINDRKIFETEVPHLNDHVHLNLTSLVINEIDSSKLPLAFETDWIRCYRKR